DFQASPAESVEGLRRRDLVDEMQINVHEGRCVRTLRYDVAIPDFFDDGTRFHNAALTAWPTSSVVAGVPFGFKSAVTRPESSTRPIAAFTAFASVTNP